MLDFFLVIKNTVVYRSVTNLKELLIATIKRFFTKEENQKEISLWFFSEQKKENSVLITPY